MITFWIMFSFISVLVLIVLAVWQGLEKGNGLVGMFLTLAAVVILFFGCYNVDRFCDAKNLVKQELIDQGIRFIEADMDDESEMLVYNMKMVHKKIVIDDGKDFHYWIFVGDK